MLARLAEAALDPEKAAELSDAGRRPGVRSRPAARASCRRWSASCTVSAWARWTASSCKSRGVSAWSWGCRRLGDRRRDCRPAVRAEAVRAVLQEESTRRAVRLMHLLTKGEASRSVSEQISSLVHDLYAIYVEAPPEAWQGLPRPKRLGRAAITLGHRGPGRGPAAGRQAVPKGTSSRTWPMPRTRTWEIPLSARGWAAKISTARRTYYRKPIPRRSSRSIGRWSSTPRPSCSTGSPSRPRPRRSCLARFDAAYQRLKLAGRACDSKT